MRTNSKFQIPNSKFQIVPCRGPTHRLPRSLRFEDERTARQINGELVPHHVAQAPGRDRLVCHATLAVARHHVGAQDRPLIARRALDRQRFPEDRFRSSNRICKPSLSREELYHEGHENTKTRRHERHEEDNESTQRPQSTQRHTRDRAREAGFAKWVHRAGGALMLATFAALVLLPWLNVANGTLTTTWVSRWPASKVELS